MLKPLLPVGFEWMMIQGVVGVLEVCVFVPKQIHDDTPLLVVSHPHPLHGGSMQNKVVQTIAKAGAEKGCLVVCYNFRGVGKSDGVFDHGHGERYDLLKVISFAEDRWGKRPLWLAGFSFGSWVSCLVVDAVYPAQLLLVAPPVSLYPMERVRFPDTLPVTVIQGSEDEVVEADQVLRWSRERHLDVVWRAKATHYFHGQLLWLKRAVQLVLT